MAIEPKIANCPKVAIIGRTNVGKSTLFNRLTAGGGQNRSALTAAAAGTTRDRKYGEVIWRGKKFEVIDTGGLEIPEKKEIRQRADRLTQAINQQIEYAIKEAEAVIFLVDGQEGLLPVDRRLALILKKIKKPFILAINKIDQQKFLAKINEFYKLGAGEPWPISAANGSGVGDLLDQLTKLLPALPDAETAEEKPALRLALIGKPNVGKSSLINAIINEERMIVDELPHTTREPQDTMIEYENRQFVLIDTAGIRKKSKIDKGLESKGVARSIRAIRQAEVAVLVIEADQPLGSQEKHLTQVITEAGCGVIIAANKWDLVADKKTGAEQKFLDYFHRHFPYLAFAPIVFISAKTGQRAKKILDLAWQVQQAREKIINEEELNKFVKQIVKAKGVRHPRIFGLKQISVQPPAFLLNIDQRSGVHFSYLRFLENRLRQEFGFIGTPIRIVYKTIQ